MPENDPPLPTPDPGELLARAMRTDPRTGGDRWTPPAPEDLAALLPQYQIESLLGHGGMGAVYKGRQATLDRPVAIKLLPAELAADPQFIARFQREARTLARLQHPGIVAVHDFGQTSEGHLYFVMEFVDGTDLHRILHTPEGLNPAQALELISQICDALHYAHGKGVIHRDIKPGNILVTTESRAKLADFGLARPIEEDSAMLTGTNVVMGTEAYMAPEQREGQADQRADIYALGVMLYEMLCGQCPRGAFTPPSQRVQIDVRLDGVVLKAMQQEPERRYQQVSEMKTDVDRIRTSPMQQAEAGSGKPERQARLAAIVATCLVLASAVGFFLWKKGGSTPGGTRSVVSLTSSPDAKSVGADGAAPSSAGTTPSVTFATATKDAPFVNTLGMKFVPVPITGGPTDKQRVLFSVWETREQDYEVFAQKTQRQWQKPTFPQGPTHPAVHINWADAQAFCAWLTDRDQKAGKLRVTEVYRLPTDHEWSCAVGIGEREDPGQTPAEKSEKITDAFPWGSAWPPPPGSGNYSGEEAAGNYVIKDQRTMDGYRDDFPTSAPVGSFAANRFGLFDLGGNVSEWCEDWTSAEQTWRVKRGTSFAWGFFDRLLSSARANTNPPTRMSYDGFRIVLAVSSTAPVSDGSNPPKLTPVLSESAKPTATFATATKDAPFVNTLGMKFVPVPITGGLNDKQRVLFSIWETRVQDYSVFAKERAVELKRLPFPQGPTHPAVCVNWADAQAFCAWLTEREQKTGRLPSNSAYRLPTDHEWSCAAGIGEREDPAKTPQEKQIKIADAFPWGSAWPPPAGSGNYSGEEVVGQEIVANQKALAGYRDDFVATAPVGSFPADRLGLFDLSGNAYEWCEDWSAPGHQLRVLRGASWRSDERGNLLASSRYAYSPDERYYLNGFRVVLADAPPAPPAAK